LRQVWNIWSVWQLLLFVENGLEEVLLSGLFFLSSFFVRLLLLDVVSLGSFEVFVLLLDILDILDKKIRINSEGSGLLISAFYPGVVDGSTKASSWPISWCLLFMCPFN